MQNLYDDIGEILAKYPEITSKEHDVLKKWMDKSEANRKIFEELTSPDHLLNMVKRFEQIEAGKKTRWQKVLDNINQTSITSRRNLFWLKKWQTFAAAASIVIIASVFVYLLQTNKQKGTPMPVPTVVKVNDAQPGKFKAKLTLDDGTVLVLDSAKNGKLVQQGSTNVINKDGQLIYQGQAKETIVLYNTLSTARGETYATVLSDGTKVWLNSQSSLRYPVSFTGLDRTVQITGEAYFEVSKDPGHPFIVAGSSPSIGVPDWKVTVLGTHFNINAYADENAMKATLLEGKVRIAKEGSILLLAPGQQAEMKGNDGIRLNKDVDVDAEVAWRFGYFQFNNADLKSVLRQLSRWYDMEIIFTGNVEDFEFLGKIPRNMPLSQVLSILEKQKVHFKIEGKKLIVSP